MASPSRTKFLPSISSSSSALFIFMFCFTMHACISSDARSIRVIDPKSFRTCEQQPFTSTSSSSPCRRIIGAEFDSRTSRSGSEVSVSSSSSSSSLDHVDYTVQKKASGGASRSQASSETTDLTNDHQDITVMDYHPPHRNSPIHNR